MVEAAALRIPGALAEGGLFWIATVVALDLLARGRKLLVAASLVLLTLVPIAANRKIARTLPEQEMFAPTQFVRYLRRADPRSDYRALGEGFYPERTNRMGFAGWSDEYTDAGRRLWFHHTPALWSRGVVFNFDFDAGDFSRLEALRKMVSFAAGYEDSPPLFQGLSLRWGIRFRDQPPLPGYVPFAGDSLQLWDRLPGALPSVRLVERWTEETSSLAALQAIPRLVPGEVVLETGVRSRAAARRGAIRMRQNLPELLVVDVDTPDLPTIAVLAAVAEGTSRIENAEHVRYKETDRLRALATELPKLGVDLKEERDSLTITGGKLQGASVHGWDDHRIVMALTLAGMVAGDTTIDTTESVSISYPDFFKDMRSLGAKIKEISDE
jgi:hypothetical protein